MLIPSAGKRTKWLKKYNFFYEMGDNIHFQPRTLPADPKYIKLHNNIAIASNVGFVTHDIIHKVFNNLPDQSVKYNSNLGCIEIMDNVFIGSGTRIMPNVRIGPNVIVAAGSVVTKDVPEGVIVAGVPAKVIGNFETLREHRAEESMHICDDNRDKRMPLTWESFYTTRE